MHEGIYLGSDAVAQNRELLQEHGVTHVVNCVGFLCANYHAPLLTYKTLYLQGALAAAAVTLQKRRNV